MATNEPKIKDPQSILEISEKNRALIDTAFTALALRDNIERFERKETMLSFGDTKTIAPIFKECFCRFDQTIREFDWIPEYDEVIDWLTDNKGKGLFLTGSCGRGKSNIINGVIRPFFLVRYGRTLPGCRGSQLPDKKGEYFTFQTLLKHKCIYIDELGTEKMVTEYGEKYEAFNDIINTAEENLNILIISTNLTGELFLKRYGERSLDRIERLCRFVKFEGNSLRPK